MAFVLDRRSARAFAADWIAAWNAHDLDRILAHYSDDFTMASPLIAQIAGVSGGMLSGKPAVGAYWAAALERYPELHFDLREVLLGAGSVVLVYDGVRGLSAEMFRFNDAGEVVAASAHYLP